MDIVYDCGTMEYRHISIILVYENTIDLRLQLLEVEDNYYLVKALYGLLMLLPQVTAFATLRQRLECVPVIQSSLQHQNRYRNDNIPVRIIFL